MEAIRELRRGGARAAAFAACASLPWLWGLPPDDRRYYPLYAECVELDIPFCLQVGHTGPLLSVGTRSPDSRTSRTSPSNFPIFAS